MGDGFSGLDGALLRDLGGQVITVAGVPATDFFVLRTHNFNELRFQYAVTGGTFVLDLRWLAVADSPDHLSEETGIADGAAVPVQAPYVQVRLDASVSDVTITRGSIYGAGSPSA